MMLELPLLLCRQAAQQLEVAMPLRRRLRRGPNLASVPEHMLTMVVRAAGGTTGSTTVCPAASVHL